MTYPAYSQQFMETDQIIILIGKKQVKTRQRSLNHKIYYLNLFQDVHYSVNKG